MRYRVLFVWRWHGDVVHVHGVLSYPINRDDGDVDDCIDVHFGDADVVVELVIIPTTK